MKKLLVILSILGFFIPSISYAFNDVPEDNEFFKAVEYLATQNILTRANENFNLENTLSRAELAKVSLISAGIAVEKATENPFIDMTDTADWARDIAHTVKKFNIMNGFADGTFKPHVSVTMAEAFKIMLNANHTNIPEARMAFFDDAQPEDWWTKYVQWVSDKNLTDLPSGRILDPHKPFPRKLMASILYRDILLKKYNQARWSIDVENLENTDEDMSVDEEENTEEEPTEEVSTTKEFDIIAKQWDFSPSTVEVNEGDTVILRVKSIDVKHGFFLSTFGVNENLNPGETKTIQFVADRKGTFPFYCSVFCGAGHTDMDGSLIVK